MSLKQNILEACAQLLDQKIDALNHSLQQVTESADNETKSTAGDKYETARAMMQMEQEKLGRQLKEISEQRSQLQKIDISLTHLTVAKGSLVLTDKGYLFISVGIGKVHADGETVIAISPLSPLGKKLIGLKPDDRIELNGTAYTIKSLA